MSIFPQHQYHTLESLHHARTHHYLPLTTRIYRSTTTATTTTNPNTNPKTLVISSPTITNRIILNDPSWQSTWSHRAWVASGCTTVLISLAKSISGSATSHTWLEPLLAGLVGYVLADLFSGVYHWGIDNYGTSNTPIFGSQIAAFQGHHQWPWIITRRQFSNNIHSLARAITLTVLPIDILFNDPVLHGFVCICSGCIMFSQQFHAWAHGTKTKLPSIVIEMQEAGILVSRSQHAEHHHSPYNNNYCIVSGLWNEFLDKNKVFEALEMIIFFKFGISPRSWSETNSDWTQDTETPYC